MTTNFDFVDTLRALVETHLTDGYPTAVKTAALMGISERTLYRRLLANHVSYRIVIDEVRINRAKHLLQDTDQRIADVAIAIGFDDAAHFTRMFRRLGGLTPRRFRKSVSNH